MEPTHLTADEVDFLKALADEAERQYLGARADKLRVIISRHSASRTCNAKSTSLGITFRCNKPSMHGGPHCYPTAKGHVWLNWDRDDG